MEPSVHSRSPAMNFPGFADNFPGLPTFILMWPEQVAHRAEAHRLAQARTLTLLREV